MPRSLWLLTGLLAAVAFANSSLAKGPVYTDPDKTDADYAFQGEYEGEMETEDGKVNIGVQIVARGQGKFLVVGYAGGLPGAGWDRVTRVETEGELKNGELIAMKDEGKAVFKAGVGTITKGDQELGKVKKTNRTSPTLGAKPPAGAVVLFDGKNTEAWEQGKLDGELLAPACLSKKKFGNHKVHIEFRLPYQPEDQGQARGNSGIYLQGRYEVQMLDSFGLEGKHNECGGIYTVKDPDTNMCLPPLAWQTYDIDYTAAKYDAEGKLVSKPRVTVQHNGVTIHDNVELPGDRNTTAAPVKIGPEPGPIHLQDHGNPVRYRNVWVVEK